MTATAAPRARRGDRLARGSKTLGWLAAAAAAAVALWQAVEAGVEGPAAVPDVLRAGLACVALFGLTGYGPARLLLPRELHGEAALAALPVGAAVSGLALSALCFAGLPFDVALVAVLVAGAGLTLVALRRRVDGAAPLARTLWPLWLAVLIAAIALLPVLRGGFATVVGQNPDAHVAAGVARFLQEAPPASERPELPVDRMPQVWRSKYPIYYPLAAVSRLSGLETYESLATVAAVMLGLAGLGMYLLARHALHAGFVASLLALALMALDRVSLHVTLLPYYNQLWGLFALPLILLFGFLYLRRPQRRTAALFLAFLAVGAAAYPLMLPFPTLALAVAAWVVWRERRASGQRPGWIRALGLPRGRRSLALWIPLGILLVPFAAIVLLGIVEKSVAAAGVLLPGGDLSEWRGGMTSYYPFGRFFGVPGEGAIGLLAGAAVLAAAWLGLRRASREVRTSLSAMAAAALAAAVYLRLRDKGEYFHFKDLAFLGPLAAGAAAVGLAELGSRARRRGVAAAAAASLVLLLAVYSVQSRDEIDRTYEQLTHQMLELRDWSARLPRSASIRLDLPPEGPQLWAGYMLSRHPLSAPVPIRNTTFPHVPRGRKADYVLAPTGYRPPDAAGEPVFRNRSFRLYRMRRSVPGPDRSSRETIEDLGGGGVE